MIGWLGATALVAGLTMTAIQPAWAVNTSVEALFQANVGYMWAFGFAGHGLPGGVSGYQRRPV